jgi:arylsulfatase A-like enzyme
MKKYILFSFVLLIFMIEARQSKKESASQNVNPNILVLLTDQWRAQSVGYADNPEVVETPNLDKLASHSANFKLAVSDVPVCTPYKASFQTGQR